VVIDYIGVVVAHHLVRRSGCPLRRRIEAAWLV